LIATWAVKKLWLRIGMDENYDPLLDPWWLEHKRLDDELSPFFAFVRTKQNQFGNWTHEPTPPERLVRELDYFYNGILLNEGAVFQFMDFMIPRRWMFEAIGAKGCLAAIDRLIPIYEELASEAEMREYQVQHLVEIQSIEALVEDPNVFGQLLLDFARRELGQQI
jgi:hypothetical protein